MNLRPGPMHPGSLPPVYHQDNASSALPPLPLPLTSNRSPHTNLSLPLTTPIQHYAFSSNSHINITLTLILPSRNAFMCLNLRKTLTFILQETLPRGNAEERRRKKKKKQ
ncbi:hypothetical protein E2C01_041383 [Portunus trituberculatus]|uniref:Uncharacterized protein n=1 Tax=Portunus trituberculatus TaxID=210409 RepID=A0A5B7FMG9_PORTR|nr:hypothetical protein [Portunus trituberculatus]